MRIAFLHQANDPYTESRIKYFISRGHEVFSIIFPNKGKIPQKSILGLTIFQLPSILLDKLPFVKRLIYWRQIRQITKEFNIDVFHIVSALNSFYLKVSMAKCNFLELQGSDVIVDPDLFPFLKSYYRNLWTYADGIIQDSQLLKDKATPYLPKDVLNECIEIGIDFTVFNPNVPKGLVVKKFELDSRPILFHSRSLHPNYNTDIVIKSIPIVKSCFPDVCFIFTGDFNALNSGLRRFILNENIENNIIFCGRLDHDSEIKFYYRDADIVISVPSSDSSPFSVYEAMAMLKPVIVSDLPWTKWKFIDNEHFVVVPPKDIQALADSIIKLINKEITIDIQAAYQIVYEKINVIAENSKLEELFLKFL